MRTPDSAATRGSVVRALAAARGTFAVRAAVRDQSAAKAQALATLPSVQLVKVVPGDAQTLAAAYSGADAVFACTLPDIGLAGTGTELAHGTAMADAAKAAGVKQLVWSALPSIKALTDGAITSKLFDDKAAVTAYIRALGLPATVVYLGSFMENYVNVPGWATYDPAGDAITLQFGSCATSTKLKLMRATKDVGDAVRIIVSHPADFVGQDVSVDGVELTVEEQAQIVARLSGKRCRAVQGPQLPVPDLDNMYKFFDEYKGSILKDLTATALLQKHGFKPASFEGFVQEALLPHLKL